MVEIVQRIADVAPTDAADQWWCAIGAQRFAARYLRPRHVEVYNRRCATGLAEAKWFVKRGRTDLANKRIAAGHRAAFRYLLFQAFPWRPSYLIRGNPWSLAFSLPTAEQGALLVTLLSHVRSSTHSNARDRLGAFFSYPKTPTDG